MHDKAVQTHTFNSSSVLVASALVVSTIGYILVLVMFVKYHYKI